MSDENVLGSYMDQMYAAMRPHQRGYLNALGMGVMGAKNLAEGAYNALLRPMQVYSGEAAPDDVGANLNFAGFAMPGQVGLRRDPMRARDEAFAARYGDSGAFSGRPQMPSSQVSNPADMGQFLQFATRKNEGASTTATGLYEQYYNWLDRHGGNPMSLPQFNQAMRDQGLTGQRIAGQMRWIGVEPLPGDAIASRMPAPGNMTTMPQYTPANTAMRMSPDEMRRLMRLVE